MHYIFIYGQYLDIQDCFQHPTPLKSIGWLVVSTPLKNMSSSVGVIIPNMMGKITHLPTPKCRNLGKIAQFSKPKISAASAETRTQRAATKMPRLGSELIMFDASADTNSCN